MKLATFLAALVTLAAAAPAQAPPHVVLILADDLGWTDLSTGRVNGGHGSPYHDTPHLDALAAAGTCFTSAYSNGPNCAPTRAALWSGQWAARTGVYTVAGGDRGRPRFRKLAAAPNERTLPPATVTLAEALRAGGYATAHFGKWHLGSGKNGAGPRAQGFGHAAGGDQRGGVGRLGNFADGDGAFAFPGLEANGVARQFMADRLTDEAIRWMRGVDGPMFCCISHYSVHTPIESPEDVFEATPEPPAGSRHRHRRYAAMLRNLDDNVGRVVAFLERTDDPSRPGSRLVDNTLILFTSDNGGLGGYRAAGIDGGKEITNQLPLRAGKGSLHEGGIRVPFIARWDGRVRRGAADPTPLQSLDVYPTLVAIAGASRPEGQPLDGLDLSARFRVEPGPVAERALFWHFPGYLEAGVRIGTWRTTPVAVIRRGDLKAMFWFEARTWALYDLAADVGEHDDVAAARPEALRPLARELRDWLIATGAPMPRTPDGEPVAAPPLP